MTTRSISPIAARPAMNAASTPASTWGSWVDRAVCSASLLSTCLSSSTAAPRIAGMLIIKEKSAALLRLRPLARPPAMVEPLRLTPVNVPTHCISPMISASLALTLPWEALAILRAWPIPSARSSIRAVNRNA